MFFKNPGGQGWGNVEERKENEGNKGKWMKGRKIIGEWNEWKEGKW